MAHVDCVLAVISVSGIEAGRSWHTRLFGRGPDNGMLNLGMSDIEEGAREHRERGIDTGEIIDANKGVRLCQ
jgi:hypothetical protein